MDLLDPNKDVRSLQRKVQSDIRYYFARRGAENMHEMLKRTFKLEVDPNTGLRYIARAVDEETKNHKETDQDIISGFMTEQKDSKYCPVDSYLCYFETLLPRSENLWQTPKFDKFPTDGTKTFYYGKMGHNKIDNFVGDICELLKFPRRYTNHTLRATAITNLKRENFNDDQIMSITGHKSSSSLDIYQKVNSSEKIEMSECLSKSLTKENFTRKCKLTPDTDKSNTENEQLPAKQMVTIPSIDQDPDFNFCAEDILQIVEQCERSNEDHTVTNVNNNNNQVNMTSNLVQRSPNIPGFLNCKIGNITINIPK